MLCGIKEALILIKAFLKDKVLIHFGAVDQIARVYINALKAKKAIMMRFII